MVFSLKNTESQLFNFSNEAKLLEILDEVKIVSDAVSNVQIKAVENTTTHQKTLDEELAESALISSKKNSKNDHSCPGWRFLGNKWQWKRDWSSFDAKQRTRRLQEKAADKAKRRKKQIARSNNKQFANYTVGPKRANING